nr:MAG TPA: hypothetical protein [Caudoviricetes sp.]
MPQLNRDDFMARINSRLGDDNSEDALNFMRDMADTFDGLSSQPTDVVSKSDFDNLQGRYDELSRNYRERFMSAPIPQPEPELPNPSDEAEQRAKSIGFKDLFSTK